MIDGRRLDHGHPFGIVTKLVSPDDAAAAILRPGAMGEATRERVCNHYKRDAIITEYRKIYDELRNGARFTELQ